MEEDIRREIERLFHEAAALSALDRGSYLDQHCHDAEVRREVEKLLAYDQTQGGGLTDPPEHTGSETDDFAVSTPGRGPVTQPPTAASESFDHGRFLPGTVLLDRYRVVALLGKGGMGEVYRADDLELGQSVALKFLPQALDQNSRALDRFRGEVRLARQVSHPNVCRVYDIGQISGQWFLSMEYVDGEDLAQLLRRIDHFSKERAIELTRQLCLGLHAAHEKGVLHRDLKPANVMIDGRGKLLITDFGLAEVAGEVRSEDIRSGTPAYMAPEQLAGREVTARSDIYSLGVVLHELFTGKPVWEAESLAELVNKRKRSSVPTPSAYVQDLDPIVERVIQRCLEPDPAKRPASAIAVMAALPGGDPLQAALAAGETPSPEMVAAAGGRGQLHPALALLCLLLTLGGLGLLPVLATLSGIPQELGTRHPIALAEDARNVLRALGCYDAEADFAFDFVLVEEPDEEASRDGANARLSFWYRQSPDTMVPGTRHGNGDFFRMRVEENDPSFEQPGMARLRLDVNGRLRRWDAIPRHITADDSTDEVQTDKVFELVGVEADDFVAAEPLGQFCPFADRLLAWTNHEGVGDIGRIEVGTRAGQVVYARVFDQLGRGLGPEVRGRYAIRFGMSLIFLCVFGALVPFNARRRHADLKGAFRLAAYVFLLRFAVWHLQSTHFSSEDEILSLFSSLAWAEFTACWAVVFYLGVEPLVRRVWPHMLTASTRLISGRITDPLVGRDILIGLCFGVLMCAVLLALRVLSQQPVPLGPRIVTTLVGGRAAWAGLFASQWNAVLGAVLGSLYLAASRVILRSRIAAAVALAIMLMLNGPFGVWVVPVTAICIACLYVRFGVLTVFAATSVTHALTYYPLTSDLGVWYMGPGLAVMAVFGMLAMFTCFTSVGGVKNLRGWED